MNYSCSTILQKKSSFQVLARKIEDLKEIGRQLQLKEAELQTIEVENKKNVEAVYQMLLKWKRKNGKDASYRVLGEALKEAGRKDLQEDLYDQGEYFLKSKKRTKFLNCS